MDPDVGIDFQAGKCWKQRDARTSFQLKKTLSGFALFLLFCMLGFNIFGLYETIQFRSKCSSHPSWSEHTWNVMTYCLLVAFGIAVGLNLFCFFFNFAMVLNPRWAWKEAVPRMRRYGRDLADVYPHEFNEERGRWRVQSNQSQIDMEDALEDGFENLSQANEHRFG